MQIASFFFFGEIINVMRGCLISLISHYINKIQVCNFFSIYIHMKRYIPVFMLFENMNISRITHKYTYELWVKVRGESMRKGAALGFMLHCRPKTKPRGDDSC